MFRASVYLDISVSKTDDLEKDREEAYQLVGEYMQHIPTSNYIIGDVGYKIGPYTWDREI